MQQRIALDPWLENVTKPDRYSLIMRMTPNRLCIAAETTSVVIEFKSALVRRGFWLLPRMLAQSHSLAWCLYLQKQALPLPWPALVVQEWAAGWTSTPRSLPPWPDFSGLAQEASQDYFTIVLLPQTISARLGYSLFNQQLPLGRLLRGTTHFEWVQRRLSIQSIQTAFL